MNFELHILQYLLEVDPLSNVYTVSTMLYHKDGVVNVVSANCKSQCEIGFYKQMTTPWNCAFIYLVINYHIKYIEVAHKITYH